jgi:hypothetical protein
MAKGAGITSLRTNVLDLLMFFTGAVLGCLTVPMASAAGQLQINILPAASGFLGALLADGKFLLLLFLLGQTSVGAVLVPPVFALDGLLLGGALAAGACAYGIQGVLIQSLFLLFRLVLVLPYGFLLGAWSVELSLSYGVPRSRGSVLLATCLVVVVAALLEATVSRWLGVAYFMKIGV